MAALKLAALAILSGVCGCSSLIFPQMPGSSGMGGSSEFQKQFMQHFHRAVFSVSGQHLFVRSDDTKPWQRVDVTLDTENGYFRQATGDMEPGQVRDLPLTGFVDESGGAFGPGNRLKSVWVQARYADGNPVNELAFPAETFGYKSPVPSAQ